MQYQEFFQRFGRSCRIKNLTKDSFGKPETKRRLLPAYNAENKRFFALPAASELPEKYIRLCPWEMEYLFCIAGHAKKAILEVGRYNGGSTFTMACANPNVPLHTIDIAPQNDDLLREYFKTFKVGDKVNLIVGDSQHTQYDSIGEVDVLFIDGDHTYDGCMADIENWYGHLTPGGHLVFHDCYMGPHGVQPAVADFMKRHPELEIVATPFIGMHYWMNTTGSIAHFIKRAR